jgi:virginiamycin B lyase
MARRPRARAKGIAAAAAALSLLFAAPAAANPSITEYSSGISGNSQPTGIARGPDGAMWFTEYTAAKIGRIDVAGGVAENPPAGDRQLAAGSFPIQIVAGSDGDLWFTEAGDPGRIGRLDPANGQLVGEYPTPTVNSSPEGITAGPDGAIWFTESATDKIGRIDPAQATDGTSTGMTEYVLPASPSGSNGPRDLAFDAAGKLWITLNRDAGGLDRLDTAAAVAGTSAGITHYDLPTAFTHPNGIARGPDDRMWVAEFGDGEVAKIDTAAVTPDTSNGITEIAASGNPFHVATAGDGDMWFTQNQSNQLFRLPPAASSGTTLDPSDGITGDPTDAASDAAGNLWFTEPNTADPSAPKIGEVHLATPTAPAPGSPTVSGTAQSGQVLTCHPDAAHWTGQPAPGFTYQWLHDGGDIAGATASTYVASDADVAHQVACKVTGTNASGSATATSAAVTVAAASPGGGPPPSPSLTDTTPNARVGKPAMLSAAGTTFSGGQIAASYSFAIGATTATCSGYDPVLAVHATQAATTPATLTVTSNTGTTATATTSLTVGAATGLKKLTVPSAQVLSNPKKFAGKSLKDALGIVGMECEPAAGPSGTASHPGSRSASSYIGQAQPVATNAQVAAGCTGPSNDVIVGIVDGLGCFQQVKFADLAAPERRIACNHLAAKIRLRNCRSFLDSEEVERLIIATATGNSGSKVATGPSTSHLPLLFDEFWVSKGPVSIDGLEIDPVGGSEIVLARAGLEQSDFAKSDAAFLISSDAMVRVGGLPITLQVPDYSAAYQQGKALASCGQDVATAIKNGDLSAADCLGSLSVPSLTDVTNAFKLPNIHGPIDLGVGPQDLGIELGSFEVPKDVLPLPVLPELPLSGKIQVNLTGLDAASVAIHVELPILSDTGGHGLTGDTKLAIDNVHGLQVDALDIDVPSLAQLGLARLRGLHFTYRKPSHYEGRGTIDLSDVIHGNVTAHVLFDKGSFQSGDVNYASPTGDGFPLFGPLFLTQLGAGLTVNPHTHVNGHALLSVGPSVTNNGCGALGIDGNVALDFGNPWSLDATGAASILCKKLGPSKRFHADSDGHFSYSEDFDYPIADLAQVHGSLGGSAYLNTNTGQLDFQLDGSYQAHGSINECVGADPFKACVGASFDASALATLALGLHGGKAVGGTGLCLHLNTPIGGFDVGAGIKDLPNALLAAATDNFPAVLSRADILVSGCNVSAWQLIPNQAGAARAGVHAAASVTEPAGQKVALIGLQGQGGAPKVVLDGPGGKKIDAFSDGISTDGGALIVRQAATGHTLVEIPHAAAGTWTVTPMAGSAPVQFVEKAHALPVPKVQARVTGRGLARVLHYRFTRQPGLAVRFFEGVDGGEQPIGPNAVKNTSGTIRFAPAIGSGGMRSIDAHVTRDSVALPRFVVARYHPGTIRPGRASHITVRHRGKRWQIAWRAPAHATSQLVTIRFVDGAQVLLTAGGSQHSLVLAAKLDHDRQPTAVQIVGLRGQARGPAASVRARVRRRR